MTCMQNLLTRVVNLCMEARCSATLLQATAAVTFDNLAWL